MSIYLVQHGISLSKEVDPERGLSAEGVSEVKRIAEVAANYGVQVNKIVHSGKTRAEQTAELFAESLKPAGGIEARQGLAPMDDITAVGKVLDPRSNIMLVGHLPFMEQLTSYLVTGSTDFTPFKFQNGGVVCLDRPEDSDRWHVKWALMPNVG